MAQDKEPKKITPAGVVLILAVLLGGLLWIMRDFASEWSGTVTGKRESGGKVVLEIRDSSGKVFEARVPKGQADDVAAGQQVSKQRFSRAITFEKIVETTVAE